MQFENFNTTMFRGFFGNELYDFLKDKDFWFKVINEPLKPGGRVTPANVSYRFNIVGTRRLVLEFNMLGVMQRAKAAGAETKGQIQSYRSGVLTHELVHVVQILSGRLKPMDDCVEWEGVKYRLRNISHWKYLQLPWEVEAYVAGYKIIYGLSEQEAIDYHNEEIYNARPWYIKLRDLFKKKESTDATAS